MSGVAQSIVMGVFVHILMLYSVFDIYFVSPVYHGMTPYKSEVESSAKRLVLFIADGLRVSSLYSADIELRAPYLSNILENTRSFGISHTQVPTESRPGHIALLAGFNEDPSALTKGWKSNPINFDSVINQSSNAWCWGSPDIVNMFNKDNLSHIHLYSYDANLQDFSGTNNSTTNLDLWVFDEVKSFFAINMPNKTRCGELCENGNILFLHLLGIDTAGHSIKPTSKDYIRNIQVVDKGIEEIVNLVENYFNDSKTAYLFTADHGMTDWGSHGDGSKDETEVPFIAWGAGISSNASHVNLEQIDIAPLISSLIGINIPVNSFGVVPAYILNVSLVQKAHILYANARQLGEHFDATHVTIERSTLSWTFQPYPDFSITTLDSRISNIRDLIASKEYKLAIDKAYETINLCKKGITYYRNYYQKQLLIYVTIGFIGWLVYLLISIIKFSSFEDTISRMPTLAKRTAKFTKIAAIVIYTLLGLIILSVFVQSLPLKFYVYCILWLTWIAVARMLNLLFSFMNFYKRSLSKNYLFPTIAYFIGIEILIVSFFMRGYMSMLLLFYLRKFWNERKVYAEKYELFVDVGAILVLTGCPILMQLQTEFSYGSLFLTMILWAEFIRTTMNRSPAPPVRPILKLQFCILYFAFFNTICVHLTIHYGYGLLLINQIISWAILVVSPIIPLLTTTYMEYRILSVMLALMAVYTLMGVGYEHLFMHLFIRLIRSWASTEQFRIRFTPPHTLDTTVVPRMVEYCFYLLIFMMFGYFGTGNTASVSSFDPMWVQCFVTVFSPFTMAGLIFVKLMIPFLFVLSGFRKLVINLEGNLHNCFIVLLLFCDIMVIHFLYFVKNEGSWLEIGVSLSRFITVNVTTIIIIILYQLADVLANFTFTGLITSFRNRK